MVEEDVILVQLAGLNEKLTTRFDGVDARLDESNGNVAALTVKASSMERRHDLEDAQVQGDSDRHKATRSAIRFWVLLVGVPIAITQAVLAGVAVLS